ncbi:Hint domain-containing protein [Pseudooceanicola nitratireducens]|uniref:Hint domain-containing protein n=1 Tax=Pseudooceanicola nitratireducens TaxID=517719 RepID=UPI001C939FDA|nr:Hint domain-containing protein [Pseudooceanicola nitratireducens]MBY6166657.1 Hint domain-containing protein [Pseudooceanicola nitratireducens]
MADGKYDGSSGSDNINRTSVDGGGDQVDGSDGLNDSIYGYGGNDTIEAGRGSDTVYGGEGADSIEGRSGDDVLYGGAGRDTIEGDAGNDTIYVGSGDDDIYGESGDDLIRVTRGTSAWIDGQSGDDTLDFSGLTGTTISSINYYGGDPSNGYIIFANGERMEYRGIEAITGTQDGRVDGSTGADSIGDGYTDGQLDAVGDADGSHNDSIYAYGGNDTVASGAGNDTVYGGAGTDALYGGAGNDALDGGSGDDALSGGSGDDVLYGGEGWDTLYSGLGNDTYHGGTGLDYIDFGAETGGVYVDLSNGTIGGAATGDVMGSGIDGVFGSNHDDTLIGFDPWSPTGDVYTNVFFGRAGNDVFDGRGSPDYMDGGSGDDTFLMTGTPGSDTIIGGEGGSDQDVIDFSSVSGPITIDYTGAEAGTITHGADTVTFSQIERIYATSSGDSLTGGAGTDRVEGRGGSDTLYGGAGGDELSGDSGDDSLYGGTGADTLYGGLGADRIEAGSGDDQIYGGAGADAIYAGQGADSIYAASGDDAIYGGSGSDVVTLTGPGNYALFGGEDVGDADVDVLDFSSLGAGGQVTAITYNSGDDESGTITFSNGDVATFSGFEMIVCFAQGTRIDTPRGPVAVEDLRPGDAVMTADHGPQPLRWTGSRRVPARGGSAPVTFATGALGNSRPLTLSPQHRVLITGWKPEMLFGEAEVLVAAKHLVDGHEVTQSEGSEITYHHLCLDRHQVLFAEGAPVESFLPAEEALFSLTPAQRRDLCAALPDLDAAARPARPILRGYEAQLLGPSLPPPDLRRAGHRMANRIL